MVIISGQFRFAHPLNAQFFTGFLQARSRSISRNLAGVKKVNPLFQRHLGPLVEVVHLKNIILWIKFADGIHLELLALERTKAQQFAVVNAPEFRFAVIHHIRAITQIEINDIHTVYLTDMLIALPAIDILRDKLGNTKQHTLEIRKLRIVLNLDDEKLFFIIFGQQVHTV